MEHTLIQNRHKDLVANTGRKCNYQSGSKTIVVGTGKIHSFLLSNLIEGIFAENLEDRTETIIDTKTLKP